MLPVTISHLGYLIEDGSILMHDQTRHTVEHMARLVCRSTSNITTKKNNQCLPLELWLQIFRWAELELNTHAFSLVQIQKAQRIGNQVFLICKEVTEWNACGQLDDRSAIYNYKRLLRKPYESSDEERPFKLPNEDARTIKISINALGWGREALYVDIDVADMISRMEHGACDFCNRDRIIFTGSKKAQEGFWEEYNSSGILSHILCPVCVGPYFANPCLTSWLHKTSKPSIRMTAREFEERIVERLQDLGYGD
ncbi:hypothetical protein NM208_g3369 [Fusarium decemcellulare]|uniref:Uncharacterized protein n=1 Tax=Fusarium decemcellulare TaxID=57161 RepID=A0ACC1SP80_9HYPO|nr:hypothetical protein NM208_g3369 [Fusarium decemcellulare]